MRKMACLDLVGSGFVRIKLVDTVHKLTMPANHLGDHFLELINLENVEYEKRERVRRVKW